jgi:2-keto-4-pentenoate hydratase
MQIQHQDLMTHGALMASSSERLHPGSAAALMAVPRLSDAQVEGAARLLLDLRSGAVEMDDFPADLLPQTTPDVQRVLDLVREGIDRPVCGWKVYTAAKNLNPPFVCPLYDIFDNGALVPARFSPELITEPEIMFKAVRDLPARSRNYSIPEIMESVTAVIGYEVLGSRFRPAVRFGDRSLFSLFTDNIGHGCLVIGDEIPNWQDIEFEDVRLTVEEDGKELVSVVGAHPFDNPFLSIVMCVNRVRRRADIHAGDILVTSASASFFEVALGSVIRSIYHGLGEVSMTFVP